ncbi:MAG TPA: exodeoxyribonuclease VII large subunit, partial [Methylosinus sp.]
MAKRPTKPADETASDDPPLPIGAPAPASNVPELSVSELANALKRTVEDRFGHVRVRGEITNYRGPHSSGHVYFSLKDQNA